MSHQAWLNGQSEPSAVLMDRGLQYGDGFFTSILVHQGRLLNWSAHWQRLVQSAERLKFPALQESILVENLMSALEQSSADFGKDGFAVIKLIITRGQGAGYAPPIQSTLQYYVYLTQPGLVSPHKLLGLNLMRCQSPANINPMLAGIKHLNRLENVMARAEVVEKRADEGLMFTASGQLVGGTQSNVILLNQGQLLTPNHKLSGVEGTCLRTLKMLALDLEWRVCDLNWQDVLDAQAVIVCNAVRGVQAVKRIQIEADGQYKSFDTQAVQPIHQAWWSYLMSDI